MFFVNAQHVLEQIKTLVAQYRPQVVTLDMSRVTAIEYSALQMLIEGEQRTRKQGAIFWLADLNPGVLEGVRAAGLAEHMDHERMLHHARVAITHYQTHYRSGPTREMTTDFPEA